MNNDITEIEKLGCAIYRPGNYEISADACKVLLSISRNLEINAFEVYDSFMQAKFSGFSNSDNAFLTTVEYKKAKSEACFLYGLIRDADIVLYYQYLSSLHKVWLRFHSYEKRRKSACSVAANKHIRAFVFERDSYKCNHCGTGESLSVDHIIPVVAGGGDDLSNLQTLCSKCNSSKGGKI